MEIVIVYMSGPFSEEAAALGIPLTVFDRSFADSVRRVREMVKRGNYDLIHCHGSRANLIGTMNSETDARTVDVHINRLRDRFRENPDFEIVTVRGLGYKAVGK